MERRRWHCYIFISIAVIIPCVLAKTFSINEAIAAEKKQAEESSHRSKLLETSDASLSSSKGLSAAASVQKKIKVPGKTKKSPLLTKLSNRSFPTKNKLENIVLGKKIPSLKYRKTFQINSPLKPKKLKYSYQTRHKRRNQSIKREISSHEKLNHKYIPLLKSLSMLVDNILEPDSSDLREYKRYKYRRNKYYSEEQDMACSCAKPNVVSNDESKEEAATTAPVTAEIETAPETTTSPAYTTPVGYLSSVRQDQDIPLLLPTDTTSGWREHHGLSERGSSTHHADPEGNIAGDYGDDEHYPEREGENISARDYEENPRYTARDDASGDGSAPGRFYRQRDNSEIRSDEETSKSREITETEIARNTDELKRHYNFEVGGDETKDSVSVSNFIRKLRGHVPKDKVSVIEQSLQPKETNEEGVDDKPSIKRITVRNGADTPENQTDSPEDEAVIPTKDIYNPISAIQTKPKNKAVVMIIDGYSVARDKNGRNNMSEKAIRIHS